MSTQPTSSDVSAEATNADPFAARAAGVLLHPSSLSGAHGIGALGGEARRFVDWLTRAGFGWWQMLPVGPVGRGYSPYSALSAFAGEEALVDLATLADEGLLAASDLRAPTRLGRGPTDHAAARLFKRPLLQAAWRRFVARGGEAQADYQGFRARNESWLEPYAELRPGPAGLHRFTQYQFDRQWLALREYARGRGVRLLGDLPIFVVRESIDVRSRPELFRLDRAGRPTVVTGVPPDFFSQRGQLWGHPHYDWAEHQRTGFQWWTERMARALELFDALRIDHFIGFHHLWEVPSGARDARRGRYGSTPGRELLTAWRRRFGRLPLIAEDLGLVTPEVHALRADFELPGMRVLQFGFGEDAYHRPHNFPHDSVCYTGTHDNDTARGWWRSLDAAARARLRSYAGASAATVHMDLARLTFGSPSKLAIVPMQDLLGLGGAARMNRPGVARGNWTWRMEPGALRPRLARELRKLLEVCERLPNPA